MNGITAAALSILGAVIGLAVVSVLVSKNAQTSSVVTATGTALSGVIGAAVNPVTNASNNGNLGLNATSTPAALTV